MFIYQPKNAKQAKNTYLIVAAHHDDGEFMGSGPIVESFKDENIQIVMVIISDGQGSSRTGKFKDVTNEEMIKIRIKEQQEASEIGHYNKVYFLEHTSKDIKDKNLTSIDDELLKIIEIEKPIKIFTHSIFDKHNTHVCSALHLLNACKRTKHDFKEVIGLEVWRNLDWLSDKDKIQFDLSSYEETLTKMLNVYESQIEGGKRYDLATLGRWRSNATYYNPHSVDTASLISNGVDMTPLFKGEESIDQFITRLTSNFIKEVKETTDW